MTEDDDAQVQPTKRGCHYTKTTKENYASINAAYLSGKQLRALLQVKLRAQVCQKILQVKDFDQLITILALCKTGDSSVSKTAESGNYT